MADELSPSIIEFFERDSGHQCGYCKGKDSNIHQGMWAHTMTVQDYNDLIDRGWRRSGCYCYKPTMDVTCCPMYTIRCDAVHFQLNNSHKKVLKKVHNFLLKGDTRNKQQAAVNHNPSSEVKIREEIPEEALKKKVKKSEAVVDNRGEGVDTWKMPQKKAKLLRLERKLQKSGTAPNSHPKAVQAAGKTLEEFIEIKPNDPVPAHRLEIKLVSTSAPEFKDTLDESWRLYVKYQTKIHQDKEEECTMNHFKRFLVKSPLQACHQEHGVPTGYGSFHQHYILDGKIIAVGVIDILPICLSAVYFFYDPDYSFLSLGTYASLREIAFVRQLAQSCPDFCWYYLGFYIHTCPKMAYKGQYKPSYLVCPETYMWHPISLCLPKLDRKKYSRLDDSDPSQDETVSPTSLSEVAILYKRRAMTFAVYCNLRGRHPSAKEDEETVREYTALVGPEIARRMLLYRS